MVTATKKVASAAAMKVSSAEAFKKNINDVLTLPSGLNIRCQRTSIQTLLAQGLIPNSLMSIVQEALAKGKNEISTNDIMSDPQRMKDMMALMDVVVVHCVKEPEVNAIPRNKQGDELPRDAELLYVDEIDDEDRSFIFQYATGGTADVEQFRKEATEQLVGVQSSKAIQLPAKRAVRNRR